MKITSSLCLDLRSIAYYNPSASNCVGALDSKKLAYKTIELGMEHSPTYDFAVDDSELDGYGDYLYGKGSECSDGHFRFSAYTDGKESYIFGYNLAEESL